MCLEESRESLGQQKKRLSQSELLLAKTRELIDKPNQNTEARIGFLKSMRSINWIGLSIVLIIKDIVELQHINLRLLLSWQNYKSFHAYLLSDLDYYIS